MMTRQTPLGSGFGASATASGVIRGCDLSGTTAIVTGGYSGLGLETTRSLSSAGAKVIVPARDHDRAATALDALEDVEIEAMDLMDPASVDAFAERFVASGQPVHTLVDSAGIMATPLVRDERGYESQFATNHLGHFQLTARLWPALREANGARVVSVSSRGHEFSPVVFEDPNYEHRDYNRWSAYGQSKTANILFALALDQRGEAEDVRAFSLHPGGIIGTGLGEYLTDAELRAAGLLDDEGKPVIDPARDLKTPEQGAATIVWCATSRQLDGLGGVYCENCDIAPLADEKATASTAGMPQQDQMASGVMPYAVDAEAADRLWSLSEQLTGATLP
jgi:NAD(P)-dependent dehydrogenase (short-subunit alcohol dehydrogenase family)